MVLFVSELSLLSRLLMPTFLADVAAAYTPDVRSSLNLGQDRSLLKNPGTRAAETSRESRERTSPGPSPCPYAPECVGGEFSEVRITEVHHV